MKAPQRVAEFVEESLQGVPGGEAGPIDPDPRKRDHTRRRGRVDLGEAGVVVRGLDFPVLPAVVLDQNLAVGEDLMAGAGIRHGGGIDGDLEIARQGGVEQLHGADDLADLGGRGPCDEAHDRRGGEARTWPVRSRPRWPRAGGNR